jgi:rubredoxin
MWYGKSKQNNSTDMECYKCSVCGYIYDPEQGDPTSGIEPGIEFSDLPADYSCPLCGAGKDDFFSCE